MIIPSKKTLIKRAIHKKTSDISKKTLSAAKKSIGSTKKYIDAAYIKAEPHIKEGVKDGLSKAKEYSTTVYEKVKPLAQKFSESTKDAAKTATRVAKKVHDDVTKKHKRK